MTTLALSQSTEPPTDRPELSIRAPKACWSQNADGTWTWYPEPEGVTHIYDPFDDDLLRQLGAVHEAGHVVTSLRAGLGVDGVHLSRSAEGHMFHAVHTGSITRRDGYMAMLAAGERAADRWLREHGQWTRERAWSIERSASSDRVKAAEFAEKTNQPFEFLAHPWDGWTLVCSWADGVLDAHWNRVTAVASALLEEGSLNAADVAHVAGLANPSVARGRAHG